MNLHSPIHTSMMHFSHESTSLVNLLCELLFQGNGTNYFWLRFIKLVCTDGHSPMKWILCQTFLTVKSVRWQHTHTDSWYCAWCLSWKLCQNCRFNTKRCKTTGLDFMSHSPHSFFGSNLITSMACSKIL